ncbi:hypothetical protein Ancab_033746 [Ancistrocladus abbreviatus]
MPKKKLNNLIKHAKTCNPRGKDYFYSHQGAENNVGGAYENEGGGASEAEAPVAQQIPYLLSHQDSSPTFLVQQYSHIMEYDENQNQNQNQGGDETEASINPRSSMSGDSDKAQVYESTIFLGDSPTSLTGFHSVDAPNSPPYWLCLLESCVSNDPALPECLQKEIHSGRIPSPDICI